MYTPPEMASMGFTVTAWGTKAGSCGWAKGSEVAEKGNGGEGEGRTWKGKKIRGIMGMAIGVPRPGPGAAPRGGVPRGGGFISLVDALICLAFDFINSVFVVLVLCTGLKLARR